MKLADVAEELFGIFDVKKNHVVALPRTPHARFRTRARTHLLSFLGNNPLASSTSFPTSLARSLARLGLFRPSCSCAPILISLPPPLLAVRTSDSPSPRPSVLSLRPFLPLAHSVFLSLTYARAQMSRISRGAAWARHAGTRRVVDGGARQCPPTLAPSRHAGLGGLRVDPTTDCRAAPAGGGQIERGEVIGVYVQVRNARAHAQTRARTRGVIEIRIAGTASLSALNMMGAFSTPLRSSRSSPYRAQMSDPGASQYGCLWGGGADVRWVAAKGTGRRQSDHVPQHGGAWGTGALRAAAVLQR